jgi:hypothetical protein
MQQKIITRADFARLAGVAPASITRAAQSGNALAPACVGKRIDAQHSAAVAYIAARKQAAPTVLPAGLDPLLEDVVRWCYRTGKFGRTAIRAQFKIGDGRAKRLLDAMQVSGLLPPAGRRKPGLVVPRLKRGSAPVTVSPPTSAPPPGSPSNAAVSSAPEGAPTVRGRAAAREGVKYGNVPNPGELPENIAAFANLTLREVVERFGTDVRFADYLRAVKELEGIQQIRIKNAKAEGALVNRALVQATVLDPIDSAHVQLMTDGARTIAARAVAMVKAGASVEELQEFVEKRVGSFIRPVKRRIMRALELAS